ncbi:uncharacterized protein LOC121641670 [Melanotaenia boesemani]|uniref:uncharacterized protein LOC121641670 n=1 Tax=Melanotaenia boesemani TaxID=1250792 RepID=UPI001C04CEAF|nr:uncharacterized protein LOC121641670 [Melanotaenia boesemani]
MSNLVPYEETIRQMYGNGFSDKQISNYLIFEMGLRRGASERSIRQFRIDRGLVRKTVSDEHLELAVAEAISKTGPRYGRKMMTGYLAAQGVRASEVRVGTVLSQMHEPYHQERRQGAENLNPQPYQAEYMGHKLHMDQNEKLAMYGVTHVLAIDGFSKKVVAHSTMPVKNNLTIYQEVYRQAVLAYGLWDQVRVDHGTEFYLSLFIQEMLAEHRYNKERRPYIQSTSTKNHTVERIWPEINTRVNYPIKTAIVQLIDQERLNMDDNLTRYCTSNLTCQLSNIGVQRTLQAWNAHRIPGKGIPNNLAQCGCKANVTEDLLPEASAAADFYRQEVGSSLTRESVFGTDPFLSEEDKSQAETEFSLLHTDVAALFDSVVNRHFTPFQECLIDLVNITRRYV